MADCQICCGRITRGQEVVEIQRNNTTATRHIKQLEPVLRRARLPADLWCEITGDSKRSLHDRFRRWSHNNKLVTEAFIAKVVSDNQPHCVGRRQCPRIRMRGR